MQREKEEADAQRQACKAGFLFQGLLKPGSAPTSAV